MAHKEASDNASDHNTMDEMTRFYLHEGREDLRLQKGGAHYLEFETATRLLERHLPPSGSILDTCAGSGAYAFHLAQQGYSVTAGDLVACNVAMMEAQQEKTPLLEQIYQGDALNLDTFAKNSFDAVLCMGALYHLSSKEDRQKAVTQSLKVLRPGGIFAATYMNRHAVILGNAKDDLKNMAELLDFAENGEQGIFYASTPEEMQTLFLQSEITPLCHAALDGISNYLFKTAKIINKAGYMAWKDYHSRYCETPSLLGYSYHNMIIGQRT